MFGSSDKRQIVHYAVSSPKIKEKVTFSVVADLHDGNYENVRDILLKTDAILVPGDLVKRYNAGYKNALRFLNDMGSMKPLFYSMGNHERRNPKKDEYEQEMIKTKAVVLNDRMESFMGIKIGGLTSMEEGKCNHAFVDSFEKEEGFRLLLCHHPEVYRDHVEGHNIDLTLCGHAHGGQVQLFGVGMYAPGQGLFPKLTHGMSDDGKMILSRGMTNSTGLPRINNPCELLIVTLLPSML